MKIHTCLIAILRSDRRFHNAGHFVSETNKAVPAALKRGTKRRVREGVNYNHVSIGRLCNGPLFANYSSRHSTMLSEMYKNFFSLAAVPSGPIFQIAWKKIKISVIFMVRTNVDGYYLTYCAWYKTANNITIYIPRIEARRLKSSINFCDCRVLFARKREHATWHFMGAGSVYPITGLLRRRYRFLR